MTPSIIIEEIEVKEGNTNHTCKIIEQIEICDNCVTISINNEIVLLSVYKNSDNVKMLSITNSCNFEDCECMNQELSKYFTNSIITNCYVKDNIFNFDGLNNNTIIKDYIFVKPLILGVCVIIIVIIFLISSKIKYNIHIL